ncbi:hypothetical protein H310_10425 [Aphanomyces invadans]|uniref:DDE Tnp4 domain-containing protein n=1 Tax=Aphanomyces invadans TaxID=157072 RepID=A0A024TRI3_9STRA|nr:hypothetical protein H310_10425 [Aphanomyces invadans]ETV96241.1 hypothetical protein H310_10425 [Aphanomyces invadans]|eukprot:XP_008875033.1 hypothetical protein H310_10425 [Aphanomyces invadans]
MVLTLRELAQIVPFVKSARQKKNFLLLCALSYVDRPLYPDVRYNLSAVSDANALLEYRFDVAGIRRLAYLLGLPAVVITKRRYRVTRDEAMCVLLGRLAFPVRFHTMTKTFGRSRAALCEIFAHVVGEIYDRWKSLMYFNDRLVRENMDTYCQAVHAKGAPLSNVYGFIDGTKLQTCLDTNVYTASTTKRSRPPMEFASTSLDPWKGADTTPPCCA